jgi:ATP-dependent RNA/DNA helicase IGHMBP2
MVKLDASYFLKLKRLVGLEEKEEVREIEEELASLSPQERELKGHALLDLVIDERRYSPAAHLLVSLKRTNRKPLPMFSLDVGDVVLLVSKKEKFLKSPRGTVYEKTRMVITLAFHRELPDSFTDDEKYDLFRNVNASNYLKMTDALTRVSEAKDTRLAHFRDISFKERKLQDEFHEYGDIQFFNRALNSSQRIAVQKSLRAKDIALIHGPPGTGKTTVLVEIVRQTLLEKKKIFVTAPSNVACDNLLERLVALNIQAIRLGHPARIVDKLRAHTFDFKLGSHPLAEAVSDMERDLDQLFKRLKRYGEKRYPGREKIRETRDEISHLKDQKRVLKKEIVDRIRTETEVFVGTPMSTTSREARGLLFDLLVFDEATQATEPMTWIPLSCTKKVVMAGDHFQLLPTVRSREAELGGLAVTLFERLYKVLDKKYKHLIEEQYRMHEKIMGFSSHFFYKNKLVADASVKHHLLSDLKGVKKLEETDTPFLFLDTAGKGFEEKLEEGSQSRYNPEEAELILAELGKMLEFGVLPSEIAVISPYSAQVRLLTSRSPDPKIEIGSVDGFQGREKELVFVSLVRSNTEGDLGFLADTRRMNVAMTRARRKLVVIGDGSTLTTIQFYKKLIDYAEEISAYKSIWEL